MAHSSVQFRLTYQRCACNDQTPHPNPRQPLPVWPYRVHPCTRLARGEGATLYQLEARFLIGLIRNAFAVLPLRVGESWGEG